MNFYCWLTSINWSDIWACITAAATVWLAIVARKQLQELNKTAQSEFLNKLKNEFFTKEARVLLTLIETSSLFFNKDAGINDFAVFEVKISDKIKTYLQDSIEAKRKYYSTQEVDDSLLGHLEDAGLLLKSRKITIKDAEQQFQYYVKTIYENEEMQKYIIWAKEQAEDDDIYSNLKYLYDKLEELQ